MGRAKSFILATASGSALQDPSTLVELLDTLRGGPGAPGPRPWMARCRSPGPSAPASPGNPRPVDAAPTAEDLRTMLRSAALASMVEGITHALALDQTRLGDQARTQSKIAVSDPRGRFCARVRAARNGRPDPGFPAVETPVAVIREWPRSAIPAARSESMLLEVAHQRACAGIARGRQKVHPAWPRPWTARPPRQSRRNRKLDRRRHCSGRKHVTRRSAASPPIAYHQVRSDDRF